MLRTTRSLQLTEAGAMALRWVQSALDGHAAMKDELAALQGKPAGLVRVACTEYLAVHIVAEVLATFCVRHPDIRVSVFTTDDLVDLKSGQYDVAIHVGQALSNNLVVRRIREVKTVLCASPAYIAEHGVPQHPSDLPQHHCLAHQTYEPRNWFFKTQGEVMSQPLQPLVITTNTSMLRQLALNGVGIARISRRMLQSDLSSGSLVEVMTDYEPTLSNGELPAVWAVLPHHRLLNRTRLLLDAIIEYMKPLG
jgi:DNA-binding transcriptional LysR family regulator